jgi:hypothetical protein
MAGVFDLHLLSAMRHGWHNLVSPIDPATKQRVASSKKFKSLFEGVTDSVLEEWYQSLAPEGDHTKVEFRPAYVPEQTKFPCVVIQYEDAPEEEAPMGYMGGHYNYTKDVLDPVTGITTATKFVGDRNVALLLRQTARVHILTSHPELTRALHIVLIGAALSSRMAFFDLGYRDLEYLGAADLSVEEGLMPEDLGVFIRVQRYQARSHFELNDEHTFTSGEVFIHASDIFVDGLQGGVDPIVKK